MPAGGDPPLSEGGSLLHGQVRHRAPRLPPGGARAGRRPKVAVRRSCGRSRRPSRIYGIMEAPVPQLLRQGGAEEGRHRRDPAPAPRARLDNVIYRLGIAPSRNAARQLVRHGHSRSTAARWTSPLRSSRGMWSRRREKSRKSPVMKERCRRRVRQRDAAPGWTSTRGQLQGHVKMCPPREDIPEPIQEQLIVELYSK